MKIDLKKVFLGIASLALVSTSVFAGPNDASREETTIVVKAGNVTSDAEYYVDVTWSDLTYDYVANRSGGYNWQTSSETNGTISITNYSNIAVTCNLKFNPIIENVEGKFSGVNLNNGAFTLLETAPEDWETGYGKYYSEPFKKLTQSTTFEANKYYSCDGAGGGPASDYKIPAMTTEDKTKDVSQLECSLDLESTGPISKNVKSGSAIGTVTITID